MQNQQNIIYEYVSDVEMMYMMISECFNVQIVQYTAQYLVNNCITTCLYRNIVSISTN